MSSLFLPVGRSFYSAIRGDQVYKFVWTPATGELLLVEKEEGNPHDRFAVAVVKGEEIVGHVPREVFRAFYHTEAQSHAKLPATGSMETAWKFPVDSRCTEDKS